MTATDIPDREALADLGEVVRRRLAADPAAHKVELDSAEVFTMSEFLSPEECGKLMKMIDEAARPSDLYEDVYRDAYRTSYSGDVDSSDSFVRMVERRLSDLLGIDLDWGETIQGQRYEPGQEFKEHFDWFDTNSKYWLQERDRGGQRSWTAMVFLNDVEAGGATHFPKLGIQVPPQRGALLVWNNATEEGVPNEETLHAALPVERGVKYVITKWFRTREWT